jgi:hypothetical protein
MVRKSEDSQRGGCGIFPGTIPALTDDTKENNENSISGLWAENRTWDPLVTKQKC